jgi:hypothetical protein
MKIHKRRRDKATLDGDMTAVNGKALCHEGVWGSGCIDLRFLDLGTSWRRAVSFTPLPLYPRGEIPLNPLDRGLGGSQIRPGQ